jgi:hypothetical protein
MMAVLGLSIDFQHFFRPLGCAKQQLCTALQQILTVLRPLWRYFCLQTVTSHKKVEA